MHSNLQLGFTLAEIAIVIFLVGIMASVGLTAINSQLARASISATQKKQEIIKDSLIAYLTKNKRLPCPAIGITGNESRVMANAPANCTGYFGILPYATLGLSKSTALDGWENVFSYAVTPQWTLTYSTAAPIAGGTSSNIWANAFNAGASGTITSKDRSPATNATPTTLSSNAVVFIVSHGVNGLGAFTAKGTQNISPAAGTDELLNVPNTTTWAIPANFYQREYTDIDVATYGAFDDITQLLIPSDLTIPLMKDGALKSAESQLAEQLTNISNALIGAMYVSSVCAPPVQGSFNALLQANGIPTVDPWGGAITYTPTFCRLQHDGLYRLSASGNCPNICGTCFPVDSNTRAFTIVVAPPTGPAITRIQSASALIAANPTWYNNLCP